MMVYRQDKWQGWNWLPQDWSDLWREEIRDRISLLDQPREVIGLTLKHLGYSYNHPEPEKIASLREHLRQLQSQVKFYSSDYYLQPLILGDTWLAVGWSGDILPVLERNPQLQAVIPRSGTALWSDVWVKPTQAQASPQLDAWMNFCWQPESAQIISLLSHGLSPLVSEPASKRQRLLFGDRALLDKSEFILPLSAATEAAYTKIWREMRGAAPIPFDFDGEKHLAD